MSMDSRSLLDSCDSHTPLPVIAGPTCSGKTHFALLLAERHGLEIISADSRQIYRGLDVGTAKPTREDRARVRHHGIDACDPRETYSVARFVSDAEAALADIASRGKGPLIVGGTGLYIRGLTAGIFEENSRDPAARERLRRRAEEEGAPALHAQLRRVDPEAASRIHPNDAVRTVRALEVFEVTGQTISALQEQSRIAGPRHASRTVVIDLPVADLDRRIDARTRAMFEHGLVEEVERLIAGGLEPDAPGLRAIGYPQALVVLRGAMTREEAMAETALQTRRFAKRQRTWFRAERGAIWVAAPDSESDEKILNTLEKTLAIL
jgi:tRNA dimethylallyltransferase